MTNQQMKFIRTSSEEARIQLKNLGFQEIPTQSSEFCFMNNTTLNFAEADMPKQIIFTNIINF